MAAERIVVGMSGGVDSAVAALLLKRAGFEVIGLFMKNWEDDDDDEYCSTRQDLIDCAAVADVIGVELEAVNFAAEYKERVFAEFLREYSAGRTPNPDVLCNAEIKFRAFLDHAMQLGATRIATGHYAGVRQRDGGYELLRAADRSKDQSYFLHRLNQAQLSRVLFPLADLQKTAVRQLAEQAGLPNFAKKDSTGICFIGERPFREFLNRYLPHTPGLIRTPEGRVLGEHVGLAFYTIGQRKGIGIGGTRALAAEQETQSSAGQPWFVAGKDMARNELLVVQGHDHPLLSRSSLHAADLSWVAGQAPGLSCDGLSSGGLSSPRLPPYGAKTRYRQADAGCQIVHCDAQSLQLQFDTPQWAVTPGQSVVLYQGEVCLGGGIIQ